jgi:diguanylate cyclase (GGDEF)-like protein
MPALDPKTVIMLCGLMGGLMSTVLYSLQRNYPSSIRGLLEWARGMLLWFLSGLGMVLLSRNGPALLAVAAPNVLLLTGTFWLWVGTQRFLQRDPSTLHTQLHAGGIGVVTLILAWFAVVTPSYRVRITLVAALLLYAFGRLSWLLARHGTNRFSARMVVVVATVIAMLQVMRLVMVAILPAGSSLFDTSPQNLIYITTIPVLVMMLAIGLVLMASDRLSAELAALAMHDSLTHALTRGSFAEASERIIESSKRTREPVSMLCMDLDHFKAINDRHGHLTGDRTLQRFVACARGVLRASDPLGRFGGEEFVAVLGDSSHEAAMLVAERICRSWEADGADLRLTVSIGVATSEAGALTVEQLIGRADAALYRAKAGGRNRVVSAGAPEELFPDAMAAVVSDVQSPAAVPV